MSVCLLIVTVSHTKTDERIEVPLEVWTRVDPRKWKSCIRWITQGKGQLWAHLRLIVNYREYPACAKVIR